jgi:DinB superfamily
MHKTLNQLTTCKNNFMVKKISLLAVLPALLSFTVVFTELTQKEKDDAAAYFNETQNNLEKALKGLSENQLKWKPNDSTWSVADCVEHIALSETNLFNWAMGTLKEPANPAKRSELKLTEEMIKKILTDRSFKVKTKEGFIPTGQFGDAWKSLDEFKTKRAAHIAYIKETKDDLRYHFAELPFGWVDSYQLLIFLSAHTQRHTLQIEEVKSNPGFPKK